ncbi:hypothetical protein GCM10010339_75210 [Streptomyces alanosinicus]|uniref:Uncharacterized protein n=1 Tax=Streptomyces alanosinicus TaxID=68171 RepID=A0A918YQ31_9ACTN|nr:hypothetical protein GCM10010339_75210 [Streptomyces alanosinicus]
MTFALVLAFARMLTELHVAFSFQTEAADADPALSPSAPTARAEAHRTATSDFFRIVVIPIDYRPRLSPWTDTTAW